MADKTYENILIEREGGITFLWLNRPDKRNAMSPGLHADMDDALSWLATDKQTKVLVLGGKGEAWCAGQDLRLYFRGTQDNPEARYKANNDSHSWRWERLSQFPKPTIAMVHGFAFGGAFTQLCACDFAIAADDATFGLSEVNWGIIPGGLVELEPDRHAAAAPRDVLRGHRRHLRRQARGRDRARQLRGSEGEAARRDGQARREADQAQPGVVRYTKEAIRAVRKMDDKQARDYLKSKQDSLTKRRQGDPRAARHEAVPGREVVPARPRSVPQGRERA